MLEADAGGRERDQVEVVAVGLGVPVVPVVLALAERPGQIYARHVGAGIGWMIFVVIGYLFFLLPGFILHIACIFSAASYARTENHRRGVP